LVDAKVRGTKGGHPTTDVGEQSTRKRRNAAHLPGGESPGRSVAPKEVAASIRSQIPSIAKVEALVNGKRSGAAIVLVGDEIVRGISRDAVWGNAYRHLLLNHIFVEVDHRHRVAAAIHYVERLRFGVDEGSPGIGAGGDREGSRTDSLGKDGYRARPRVAHDHQLQFGREHRRTRAGRKCFDHVVDVAVDHRDPAPNVVCDVDPVAEHAATAGACAHGKGRSSGCVEHGDVAAEIDDVQARRRRSTQSARSPSARAPR